MELEAVSLSGTRLFMANLLRAGINIGMKGVPFSLCLLEALCNLLFLLLSFFGCLLTVPPLSFRWRWRLSPSSFSFSILSLHWCCSLSVCLSVSDPVPFFRSISVRYLSRDVIAVSGIFASIYQFRCAPWSVLVVSSFLSRVSSFFTTSDHHLRTAVPCSNQYFRRPGVLFPSVIRVPVVCWDSRLTSST